MVKYYENYDQANMVYQESLDNLTPDRLMKFIKHHYDYQRPRLVKLDRYYKGFNTGILDQDNRRHEKGKSDHRITHSFGKYIADFQTSYSVGNPINVKTENDEVFYQQSWVKQTKISSAEIGWDVSIPGMPITWFAIRYSFKCLFTNLGKGL